MEFCVMGLAGVIVFYVIFKILAGNSKNGKG